MLPNHTLPRQRTALDIDSSIPKPIPYPIDNMPSPFGDAPVAKSLLDFQRVLSPTAGVRVSPLCLGAMNFGDAWSDMMGKCDKKTVFEILDFFYEQGGNFIDT